MILELLEFLADKELPATLIIGANVQEEVGLRGAKVSTTMFKPDLFFAVDCSPASDTFGDDNGRLGEGTTLRFFDPGHIMLPGMKNCLKLPIRLKLKPKFIWLKVELMQVLPT